jgi:ubiquinone/menaquinone biosynthesis C-methylase UbiE
VPERVDFSANVSVYDRRHGAALSDEDLDRLWQAAGLRVGVDVLDVGAGTGRVAPLRQGVRRDA